MSTDTVVCLDEAASERHQPIPIKVADLYGRAHQERDRVLDRIAVVRVTRSKNSATIAALEENNAVCDDELAELEQIADALLTEIHALDRLNQSKR